MENDLKSEIKDEVEENLKSEEIEFNETIASDDDDDGEIDKEENSENIQIETKNSIPDCIDTENLKIKEEEKQNSSENTEEKNDTNSCKNKKRQLSESSNDEDTKSSLEETLNKKLKLDKNTSEILKNISEMTKEEILSNLPDYLQPTNHYNNRPYSVEEKFKKYIEIQKTTVHNFNNTLIRSRNFRNPYFLKKMSDRFGITENGTNDTKELAIERKTKDTIQNLRAFYKHLRQSERFKKIEETAAEQKVGNASNNAVISASVKRASHHLINSKKIEPEKINELKEKISRWAK